MAEKKTSKSTEGTTKTPETEIAPTVKRKKQPRYVSVKVQLYHPFQKTYIPTGSPGVLLDKDSWLQSQLDRELVKEI